MTAMTSYPGSQTRRDPHCGRQPRKQRKHLLRRAVLVALLPLLTALGACAQSGSGERSVDGAQQAAAPSTPSSDVAVAVFAGGCFWCMEPPYDELPGVLSTTSGYTGGNVANPTYEQVSAGHTGHTEAVQVK